MRIRRKRHGVLRKQGFTLLELLVVVAILALIAAVAGWARWGESPHVRVAAGQRTMLAMVRNVQQQAQAEGVVTALLVHADATQPDRYLRMLVPAKRASSGWQAIGQGILLPRGIWVVPSEAEETPGEDWHHSLRSLFSNGNQKERVDVDGRGASWFYIFAVGPDGRSDSVKREDYLAVDMPGGPAANQRLCLSPGRRTSDGAHPVQWTLPRATSGVEISRNGIVQSR